MRGDGFVNPLTDRAETIICLLVAMGIVGMAQTQDEEDIQQQIETECGYRKRPQRPRSVGWAMQERHG